MHSSISSFDAAAGAMLDRAADDEHVHQRETASDRPGVAQPVPKRPVPVQPWRGILLGALVMFSVLLGAWEWYWRDFGVTPGIRNTYGLWAIQRRRIDNGEGDATVLLGASRVYFDLQLPVWEKLAGKRPIQLAYEGTTPLGYLEDLAADQNFTGRALVGVAPDVFFSGYAYRGGADKYTRDESPSQRVGQWLSMNFVEPYLAFYDPDYALATVVERQPWPDRPGRHAFIDVRKLSVTDAGRNTHMWSKVVSDPDYRALARSVWAQDFEPSDESWPPEKIKAMTKEQIERAVKAVATLRARGVPVVFVRMPSNGRYLEYENKLWPRAETWDVLLAATGAPGIYFQDYPELNQDWELPEWSHLSPADAERFTAALYGVIARDFWKDEAKHAH
jgi:hypothetical protein